MNAFGETELSNEGCATTDPPSGYYIPETPNDLTFINSDNYEFNWNSFTFSSDPYESETDGNSQFFMSFYINECIIDNGTYHLGEDDIIYIFPPI